MKLVQTTEYLLLIDEEAEIKGTPCLCYNSIKNTWGDDVILYQGSMPEYHYKGFQKIIAYYPLTKEAEELDLPLLPNPFEEEIDIEKLIYSKIKNYRNDLQKDKNNEVYKQNSLLIDSCFSKAMEIVEECFKRYEAEHKTDEEIDCFIKSLPTHQLPKQFSLEDIKSISIAFAEHCKSLELLGNRITNYKELFDDSIEEIGIPSLSTQQLPKEFVPEIEYFYEKYLNKWYPTCESNYTMTKRDWGDDKVKTELKTITNSESKEELVGTYK